MKNKSRYQVCQSVFDANDVVHHVVEVGAHVTQLTQIQLPLAHNSLHHEPETCYNTVKFFIYIHLAGHSAADPQTETE